MSSVWLSRTLLHLIMSELADASGKSGLETKHGQRAAAGGGRQKCGTCGAWLSVSVFEGVRWHSVEGPHGLNIGCTGLLLSTSKGLLCILDPQRRHCEGAVPVGTGVRRRRLVLLACGGSVAEVPQTRACTPPHLWTQFANFLGREQLKFAEGQIPLGHLWY